MYNSYTIPDLIRIQKNIANKRLKKIISKNIKKKNKSIHKICTYVRNMTLTPLLKIVTNNCDHSLLLLMACFG